MLDLSIYVNPGYFPTWGQEQNQITITRHATLRQLEILGDNGEEEAKQDQSQGKGLATQILSSRGQRTQGGSQMHRGVVNHRTPQGIHLFLGQN